MTCAKGYHKNIPQNHLKLFKYFPCEDKESCDISRYFEEAVEFIKESLEKTNVSSNRYRFLSTVLLELVDQ